MPVKVSEKRLDLIWPSALGWPAPGMAGVAAWNTQVHKSFLAMSDEWQAFVARRLKEDLHLLQAMGAAKTPEAFWSAYADFWQRAVEDYWKEYGALVARASGLFAFGMTPSRCAIVSQPESTLPQSKAA